MDAQHMPTPRRVSFWPIPTRVGPIGGYNGDFYSALTYAPPPEPALGLQAVHWLVETFQVEILDESGLHLSRREDQPSGGRDIPRSSSGTEPGSWPMPTSWFLTYAGSRALPKQSRLSQSKMCSTPSMR
jgi:hypothetical protein